MLAFAAFLTACSGGGGGSTAPAAVPTLAPTSATSNVTVTSAAATVTLPPVGGYTATASFPSSDASGPVAISSTVSTTRPSGLPALQSGSRVPKTIATHVYLFLAFVSPVTITFTGLPGFTMTMPSTVNTSAEQFYLAVYANGAWQEPAVGPAAVQGQQISFPEISGNPVTMQANTPVYIALYGTTVAAPGAITLSPASLNFTAVGTAATQSVTGSQPNFSGYLSTNATCKSGNTTIATVGPGANVNQFSITPVAAGSCTLTIYGGSGQTANLPVSVTTTTINGQ